MTEYQINARRNWKAQTFPYDHYIPDDTQECQYCLTEKQAEILRGIVEPLAWDTRWWSDSSDIIDRDAITAFRDDLVRRLMMSCCGDEGILFRYNGDGVLQQSDDGGVTWVDAPQKDPRNNSPQFPPLPGDDGDDKKCLAATGMAQLMKEQVANQLTDDMSRYTLEQLLKDWTSTAINSGGNIFQILLTIATNQIFALVIATLRAALTDEVFDTLKCIFLAHIQSDASFDEAGFQAVLDDIGAQISGVATLFLQQLVNLLGVVGLTNLARAGGVTTADCSDCGGSCNFNDWTTTYTALCSKVSTSGQSVTWQSDAINGDGKYYVIIQSSADNDCCYLEGTSSPQGFAELVKYVLCNDDRTQIGSGGVTGNPTHLTVNALLFRYPVPFQVTITAL